MSEPAITTSTDLVHTDARRRTLATLNQAAEQTTDPLEARNIMLQAKAIAELLESAKAPFDEARLAGKASVISARKVGRFIEQANPKGRGLGRGGGTTRSERGLLLDQLGIATTQGANLRRLARVAEPDFQRYIQLTDRVPSVNGCLASTYPDITRRRSMGSSRTIQRRRAGVKEPRNPSLDEAYGCVVRALGHASAMAVKASGNEVRRDVSSAMEHLYAAEDLLRPHLGGYTSPRSERK